MKATFFACTLLALSCSAWASDPLADEITPEGEESSLDKKQIMFKNLPLALSATNRLSDLREGIQGLGDLTRNEGDLRILFDRLEASLTSYLLASEANSELSALERAAHFIDDQGPRDEHLIQSSLERHLWLMGSVLTANAARPDAQLVGYIAAALIQLIKFPKVAFSGSQSALALRIRTMLAIGELIMVSDQEGKEKIAELLSKAKPIVFARDASVEFKLYNYHGVAVSGQGYADFINDSQKQLFSMLEFLVLDAEEVQQFLTKYAVDPTVLLSAAQVEPEPRLRALLSAMEFIQSIAHSRGRSLQDLAHPDFLKAQRALIEFNHEAQGLAEIGKAISNHYAELNSRFEKGGLWDASWIFSRWDHDADPYNLPYAVYHRNNLPNPKLAGGKSLALSLQGPDGRYLVRHFPSLGMMTTLEDYLALQDRRNIIQKMGSSIRNLTSRLRGKK